LSIQLFNQKYELKPGLRQRCCTEARCTHPVWSLKI